LRQRLVVASLGEGAALAESFSVAEGLAFVVDAFTTLRAGDAGGFVAGHLARVDGDGNPLFAAEVFVGEFAVGEHLLLVLVFDVRVEVAGALFGGLEGGDAKGFVDGGVALGREGRREIDEGRGHLAPVAKFYGALAESAAGDDGDGVGGAAVNLDKGDEALAVDALWVVDAEAFAAKHSHADAEDLASAQVAVGDFGFAEESVEGLHNLMILLAAGLGWRFDGSHPVCNAFGLAVEAWDAEFEAPVFLFARCCATGVVFEARGAR
jgi:hypothetical protein